MVQGIWDVGMGIIVKHFGQLDYCITEPKIPSIWILAVLIQLQSQIMRKQIWQKAALLTINSLLMFQLAGANGPEPLKKHLWKDRVILLFSESGTHPDLQSQLSLLTKETAEVTDRDLVVYQVLPNTVLGPDGQPLPKADQSWFYTTYVKEALDGFTFLLIGKDGTVKLKTDEPVPMRQLFGLIDGMPMRQAEMRRQ